jgi:hypothetical protein
MAININSPISADLMYQFYDNKAITPKIRSALQKKQEAAGANESKSPGTPDSGSKFGPATRVSISDQLIRMNSANNATKTQKEEEPKEGSKEAASAKRKPSRYDVLEEVKKSVAEREAKAKEEKDNQLKEIADKVAADKEKPGNTP